MGEERQTQEYIAAPLDRPWPRRLLRQALALSADHLQRETAAPFPLSSLLTRLGELDLFDEAAGERWLATALKERLILVQQPTIGSLNRSHPLVQKALLIRERILTTTSILQEQEGWVAFTTLEQALRTCRICAGDVRARRLWLELLIKLNVLHARLQAQPDGPFQTTVLTFNQESPVVAIPKQQQQRNLLRLILICSSYSESNQASPLAASHIVRTLTGPITRVEARTALAQAEQEGLIAVEYLEGGRRAKQPLSGITLQQGDERVRACLELRDHLIRRIEQSLRQRPSGISASALVGAFWHSYQLPEEEGWFWLRVLEQTNIVRLSSLEVGREQKKEKIVDLRLGDPVVKLAQQHARR
jgi:hypothetical protein